MSDVRIRAVFRYQGKLDSLVFTSKDAHNHFVRQVEALQKDQFIPVRVRSEDGETTDVRHFPYGTEYLGTIETGPAFWIEN